MDKGPSDKGPSDKEGVHIPNIFGFLLLTLTSKRVINKGGMSESVKCGISKGRPVEVSDAKPEYPPPLSNDHQRRGPTKGWTKKCGGPRQRWVAPP